MTDDGYAGEDAKIFGTTVYGTIQEKSRKEFLWQESKTDKMDRTEDRKPAPRYA